MPGGDQIGTQGFGVGHELLELDLPIAEHVRIRRSARVVFLEKLLEDVVPVLGGEVGRVQLDVEGVADLIRIEQIRGRRAVLRAVVFIPVLHEKPEHAVTLLFEQQGGHRGIHAAGHADHHRGLFRAFRRSIHESHFTWVAG